MAGSNKILIVDDIEVNRDILTALLEDKYEILTAVDGEDGFEKIMANAKELSLILLDLMMPKVDGFQVLEMMRAQNLMQIPVIIITASNESQMEAKGLTMGAVDYISKPFDPSVVSCRVDTHVKLKQHQDHLEALVQEGIDKMASIWMHVIQSMADLIECRSEESGQHVKRTTAITKMILERVLEKDIPGYYLPPKIIRYAVDASSLHDIGKIAVPDAILKKPGRLTDEEYEAMKAHSAVGAELVQRITRFEAEDYRKCYYETVRHHHERWDGNGYPDRLAGENIPLSARAVALADTYDAITNTRVYRVGMSHEEAINIIFKCKGTQFDPVLVDVLLEIQDDVKNLKIRDDELE